MRPGGLQVRDGTKKVKRPPEEARQSRKCEESLSDLFPGTPDIHLLYFNRQAVLLRRSDRKSNRFSSGPLQYLWKKTWETC